MTGDGTPELSFAEWNELLQHSSAEDINRLLRSALRSLDLSRNQVWAEYAEAARATLRDRFGSSRNPQKPRLYTHPVRILVNFMHRDVWHVHSIAEDARTPVGQYVSVTDEATLIRLLRYVGATEENIEQVREDIRRWNRGGVWIELTPGRKNLLRIRLPWSDQARLAG
jgi:hypothetical protein